MPGSIASSRKILSLPTLARTVRVLRAGGKKIIMANGVFDLVHVGHVRYLAGAKRLGDVLVVAVNSDASVKLNKGPSRPHVPEAERAEIVAALSVVDYVVLFDDKTVEKVLRAIKPDIQAKGTDYTVETVPEREIVRSYGGRVAITGDPKDHSSTAMIGRLKKK